MNNICSSIFYLIAALFDLTIFLTDSDKDNYLAVNKRKPFIENNQIINLMNTDQSFKIRMENNPQSEANNKEPR